MKVETTSFAQAMKAAAATIGNSTAIPILNCVRLEAADGKLEIRVNDTEAEYRQIVTADGEFVGAVEAKRLSAIAQAAPNGSLSFDPDGLRVTIKSGRSRWTMPVLDADQFPEMPIDDLCTPITFIGGEMADIIRRTTWCTDPIVARPYLNGVWLHNEGGHVRFAACNGPCCIVVDTKLAWPIGAPDVIVPAKFLNNLRSVCTDGAVTLAWDNRKIRAVTSSATLTGKLIDGTIPSGYRQAIPEIGPAVVASSDDLIAAARRIQIASDARTRVLTLERSPDTLSMAIAHDAGRDAAEEVSAECDGDLRSGVSAQFFIQMLEAIGGETVEIHQHEANQSMRFQRVVKDGAIGVVGSWRI